MQEIQRLVNIVHVAKNKTRIAEHFEEENVTIELLPEYDSKRNQGEMIKHKICTQSAVQFSCVW